MIPNLRTLDLQKEEIDLSLIELTHYKLHQQKAMDITLQGEQLHNPDGMGTGVGRDPEKAFLSEIVAKMNELFEGDFTDVDGLNYLRTLSDKMRANEKVLQQVRNNSKEQAMIGGFETAFDDAVIDSLDVHQNMARQVLSEERVRKDLADIVYDLILKGMTVSESPLG